MGFFDKIGDALLSIPKKVVGGVLDVGSSLLGDTLIGDPNSAKAYERSKEAYEQQYSQYKRRYQDTMSDMKLAGLNPILAAGSGGFNVGGSPSFTNVGQMPSYQPMLASSAYQSFKGGQLSEEQSKTEDIKRLKLLQDTKESLAKVAKIRAEKGLLSEKERLTVVQISESLARTGKMFHEVKKIGVETDRGKMELKKLKKQIQIMHQQFKQLKQTSDWYDGAYGDFLGWLRATLGSFGTILGTVPQLIK